MSSSILRGKNEPSCSGTIQFVLKTGKADPERTHKRPLVEKILGTPYNVLLWSIWSIYILMKRTTVDKDQEVYLWAEVYSCLSLSVFPETGIKYFASPTPVLPKTHFDYIKQKLKHLWLSHAKKSCKEVLRARTKPSQKNLAQLQGVTISCPTWECAARVMQGGCPAKSMSHYDTLLTVNQYSVGLPGTLSFIIYSLAASFMVMIPGGSVGAVQEDQGWRISASIMPKTTQDEKVVGKMSCGNT